MLAEQWTATEFFGGKVLEFLAGKCRDFCWRESYGICWRQEITRSTKCVSWTVDSSGICWRESLEFVGGKVWEFLLAGKYRDFCWRESLEFFLRECSGILLAGKFRNVGGKVPEFVIGKVLEFVGGNVPEFLAAKFRIVKIAQMVMPELRFKEQRTLLHVPASTYYSDCLCQHWSSKIAQSAKCART